MEAITACCSVVDWSLRNLSLDARKSLFLGLAPIMRAVDGGTTLNVLRMPIGNLAAENIFEAHEHSHS